MKVAIVHDDFVQEGGAEKVVEAMCEIWPDADVYTSLVSPRWLSKFTAESSGLRQVRTSFMQNFPFKDRLYRQYLAFYPAAFESFDFSSYDVVISSSARFAHGVITPPRTLHICYMHSVPRMWWGSGSYFAREWCRILLSPVTSYLRIWDRAAAQRVDCFVANSKHTAARVNKFYRREAEVIYPFVDLEKFRLTSDERKKGGDVSEYFLVVSRLVRWKRLDLAIEACLQAGVPLKIIGEGPDMSRLQKLAVTPTVEFLGRLPDAGVVSYMSGARALLFPQCEDLGMTLLEALATGTPVLAFKDGGALETMVPGETGEFFYPQTAEALAQKLKSFEQRRYNPSNCHRQAHQFSRAVFLKRFESFVATQYATLRAN